MVTTAIILAGGLGTRLEKLIPNLPKPMAPIHNRPFLEYQMDYWIKQGITKFVLSVGYKKQTIIDYFGDSYNSASIEYVLEESPLGTGGGMLVAAQNITEPFLLLNGDTLFEVELNNLITFHKERKSELTLTLFRSNNSKRYKLFEIKPNGEILFLESLSNKSDFLANGGVYLINPSALVRLNSWLGKKVSLEDELLPNFTLSGGVLYGLECLNTFIDIGIPEDYYRSSEILTND